MEQWIAYTSHIYRPKKMNKYDIGYLQFNLDLQNMESDFDFNYFNFNVIYLKWVMPVAWIHDIINEW